MTGMSICKIIGVKLFIKNMAQAALSQISGKPLLETVLWTALPERAFALKKVQQEPSKQALLTALFQKQKKAVACSSLFTPQLPLVMAAMPTMLGFKNYLIQ